MANKGGADVALKAKYHHGDLREALITAAYAGISKDGADSFTMADACRLAGVSTAAPYRHFKDRDELLAEVTARGFDNLSEQDRLACEAAGEGTVAGIVALGQTYVRFAIENPGLFRLMFGQSAAVRTHDKVQECGHACFGYVIGQVTQFCEKNGMQDDAREIATSLWTYVHGMSSLSIDGNYAKVTPEISIEEMLEKVTPQLLGVG